MTEKMFTVAFYGDMTKLPRNALASLQKVWPFGKPRILYGGDAAAEVDDLIRREAETHAKMVRMREALTDLVDIIDKAGLLNLSNGVQLGPTSWYVKASDRMNYARAVLEDIP